MARLTPQNSPKGFWPNPEMESFFKLQTPPLGSTKEEENQGGSIQIEITKTYKI